MAGTKLLDIQINLRKLANPERAKFSKKFFKCAKGEYGEGDDFLGGINTPTLDAIVKKYRELPITDIQVLIKSKYHEERMAALGVLKWHFSKANKTRRKNIVNFYLNNTKYINNWDLVDVTAPKILGVYLAENPDQMNFLDKLSDSKNLWERRIAVISTLAFIRQNNFAKTLEYAQKRLNDKEDLMHKVVGWMLREVGKKDQRAEEEFLKKYYSKMPRTMLRYAIEKFPEPLRKKYLLGMI